MQASGGHALAAGPLVAGLAGVLAIAALAGCAPTPAAPASAIAPTGPGEPAAPAAPAAPQPQRGGVLQTIGLRDLPQMHPWTNTSANTKFFLSGGVYDQLVDYDFQPFQDWREEYRIVPELAERWELRDRTDYLFSLRRGVKWHDGEPLTAHDVKWSFDALMDPGNSFPGASFLRGVASISIVDDQTLRVVLKAPDILFLDKLTEGHVSILPRHVFERGDKFEAVAVGTGPFKLQSHDRLKGVTYAPNEEYWRPGRPHVARWRILGAQDDAGRIAAFIGRQNDVLKVPNRRQAEPVLAQAPAARSLRFLRDIASDVFFKLDAPPFNDVRVRQAVHLGVDRRTMVSTLTFGDGIVNPPGINAVRKAFSLPPEELDTLPGWREPKDQDLAEARRLLAEAGYGKGLSFTMNVDQAHPDRPALAEIMSAQLRQIGVDMKIQPLESGVYNKAMAEGDYQAAMHRIGYTQPEAEWSLLLHSKGSLNRSPVQDPELDRLLEAQAQEFDPARRRQTILDIQRLLLRQMYVMPTITHAGYLTWQPYVHGWVDNQAANVGNVDWGQLWLDQADVPKDRS